MQKQTLSWNDKREKKKKCFSEFNKQYQVLKNPLFEFKMAWSYKIACNFVLCSRKKIFICPLFDYLKIIILNQSFKEKKKTTLHACDEITSYFQTSVRISYLILGDIVY